MKKQVDLKLWFVLLAGVAFSLTATAATTLTPEVLLYFDGTLSGDTYTLDAGEIDTSGTLVGYNSPTVAGGTLTTGLNSTNQGMRIDTPGVIDVDTSFILEVVADIDWAAQGTTNATFADALGNFEIRFHGGSGELEFTHWSNTTGGRSVFTALPAAGMHHYAGVWTADGAGGTGVGSLYIDGVLIGSTSGGGMRADSNRAGWAAFSRFQARGAKNSVFDAAALSTFTGTFDPSADMQVSILPVLIAPTGSAVDTTTSLQWGDPLSYTPTGYDLVFRADDANFLDTANNIIEITDQTAASPEATPTLANNTTYFWRVDPYEPNSVGTMVPIRREGPVWTFTTVTADPAPVVDAGFSYVTWIGEMVSLAGTVTDGPAGDIVNADVVWSITDAPAGSTAGISKTSTDPLAPTAEFTPDVAGDYTIELTATDTALQVGSDTLTVQVGADTCAAAALDPGFTGFNTYDSEPDCDVDLVDFAAFAAQWLDDINLTAPVAY